MKKYYKKNTIEAKCRIVAIICIGIIRILNFGIIMANLNPSLEEEGLMAMSFFFGSIIHITYEVIIDFEPTRYTGVAMQLVGLVISFGFFFMVWDTWISLLIIVIELLVLTGIVAIVYFRAYGPSIARRRKKEKIKKLKKEKQLQKQSKNQS